MAPGFFLRVHRRFAHPQPASPVAVIRCSEYSIQPIRCSCELRPSSLAAHHRQHRPSSGVTDAWIRAASPGRKPSRLVGFRKAPPRRRSSAGARVAFEPCGRLPACQIGRLVEDPPEVLPSPPNRGKGPTRNDEASSTSASGLPPLAENGRRFIGDGLSIAPIRS